MSIRVNEIPLSAIISNHCSVETETLKDRLNRHVKIALAGKEAFLIRNKPATWDTQTLASGRVHHVNADKYRIGFLTFSLSDLRDSDNHSTVKFFLKYRGA